MCKTVIRITIAGILCVAAGSVLAQGNSAGRAPAAGAVASGNIAVPALSALNRQIGNIAVPSVSALNRPIAVPVARTPDLVAAPQGLAVATANFAPMAPARSGAAPGSIGLAPGRSDAAPGLAIKSTDQEISTKESGSSRSEKRAALAVDEQQKRLHQIPTCN